MSRMMISLPPWSSTGMPAKCMAIDVSAVADSNDPELEDPLVWLSRPNGRDGISMSLAIAGAHELIEQLQHAVSRSRMRTTRMDRIEALLQALQQQAEASGADQLTDEQIEAEIAAVRAAQNSNTWRKMMSAPVQALQPEMGAVMPPISPAPREKPLCAALGAAKAARPTAPLEMSEYQRVKLFLGIQVGFLFLTPFTGGFRFALWSMMDTALMIQAIGITALAAVLPEDWQRE